MAVPKKKTSPSRRNMRRSHDALSKQNIIENKTTGEFGLSHHITADGYYKGKQIIFKRASTEESQDIKSAN
ncbi:MAG: 50S ribosomal protein L32 [Rickettsiales bacterium]|nr:50S ribosomal protein L32 [Rickettsiales bacterium]